MVENAAGLDSCPHLLLNRVPDIVAVMESVYGSRRGEEAIGCAGGRFGMSRCRGEESEVDACRRVVVSALELHRRDDRTALCRRREL